MIKRKTVAVSIGMMLAAWGLVLLKLLGVAPIVGWSWWVVFAPLWFPWAVTALAAFCILFYQGLTRIDRLPWLPNK